ncbi:MAG: SET domain-containing protein-lysine N-methyltransferase [Acidobacteriales bacterium]|nr:SET domain-containing protein-lysine N-methyltransferase [Terriglobales bacterium]
MGLIVRTSDIHAIGVFTTTGIPVGARIVEYTGPRISEDDAGSRYSERDETYLFGLTNSPTVIDGTGVAAFINHSCAANCEADEVDEQVWIIALRAIRAGEELTYDYNLYDGDESDLAPCYCGAPGCRGTMYGEDELIRRRKASKPNDPQTVSVR